MAKILRVPDIPINFANVPSVTTGTRIGLQWQSGPESGGSPVLDYTILYDQGLGGTTNYITLIANLAPTSYTLIGLTVGTTYQFKISARNEVGSSEYSTPISILAAQQPNKPAAPTTVVSGVDQKGPNVEITWTAPPTGGSDITGYIITIKSTDPNGQFL